MEALSIYTGPARVVGQERLAPAYFRLVLAAPEVAAVAQPGQFVMLRCWPGADPLLARPFSLHRFRPPNAYPAGGQIEIVYRQAGAGTALMAALAAGDTVRITGPLGHGFAAQPPRGALWLVAGGYGVAPLLGLAEAILERRAAQEIHLFYGAKSAPDLLLLREFEARGIRLHLTTEDGSAGEKGLVTVPLERELANLSAETLRQLRVAACGPERMLGAVAQACLAREAACEVSLESRFACGFGACLGCVKADRAGRYRVICREGPVFSAAAFFAGEPSHEQAG